MLLSEEVEVNARNKQKYYKQLGYEIPLERKQLWYKGKKCGKKYIVPKGAKITVKAKDLPLQSSVRVDVKCDNCGREYSIAYSNYNRQTESHDGKLYCCDCANTVLLSGENNNFWNPNLSNEERQERNVGFRHIDGYKDFVKIVLKNANYKCYVCNSNNELEVHHLDGYEWCKEKRVDPSNGVCLCSKCHKIFHSIYGHKGNTKEQFEEWIGKQLSDNNCLPLIVEDFKNKVICLETNIVYDTCYDCELQMYSVFNTYVHKRGIGSNVRGACERKGSSKGYHFLWYNDYLNMSQKEINKYANEKYYSQPNLRKSVVCIEKKLLFDSVTNAVKYFGNTSTSNLSRHINGKKPSYAKCHWCYLEDYSGDVNSLEEVIINDNK